MTLRCLPPAGQPIDYWHRKPPALVLAGYSITWLSSGTAALAYSLLRQRLLHPEVTTPQVIVPAYCCPDLLSAAQYAGYEAVIVDIQADDPGFNLTALKTALTESTLAVIAINFLGIAENLAAIRSLIAGHERIALVEDNAQWFPPSPEEPGLQGDFITFSFGRGKAIGLLGGGLVAVRDDAPAPAEQASLSIAPAPSASLWPLKAGLVNLLSRPRLYYGLTRLPMLNLGETKYHPLDAIAAIPKPIQEAFEANHARYRARPAVAEHFLDHLFQRLKANRLAPLFGDRRRNLLRYPVLCDTTEARNNTLMALNRVGLGATALYQKPLARVKGVSELAQVVLPKVTPGADAFAARLLTLPVHSGVTQSDLDRMARLLETHGSTS